MYISKVTIDDYRGFSHFEAELSKLTVIIGENESGKSNFFSALSLPLSNNDINFNRKRLEVADINSRKILQFYKSIIEGEDEATVLAKIPVVRVVIEIRDPRNEYEESLLKNWLCDDESGSLYSISYIFQPKKEDDLIKSAREILKGVTTIDDVSWFTFPIENYDYQVSSTNNGKQIGFRELKRLSVNLIGAERDDFAQNNSVRSNNVLTRMLMSTLDDSEKAEIDKAYTTFFKTIEGTDTFQKLISPDPDFKNFSDYIEDIDCIPNLPNLRSILSNITLKAGDVFLYQRGLGERNLIHILILFEYFKKEKKYFNLCCIEEPEAHLSVNNLKLATDFINKSTSEGTGLLQTLVSSHSPSVINKLELSNVLVFSGDKAISLKKSSSDLQDYLRKRPNFDILKLLFANKLILVEGPTEEMLINSVLQTQIDKLRAIDVVSIGHKGFRTFLDIWLEVNRGNAEKKIGIVRDYDGEDKAKADHDKYDAEHVNICVRTTVNQTLENDLAEAGGNLSVMQDVFDLPDDCAAEDAANVMISDKAETMLALCDSILDLKKPKVVTLPPHIQEVIDFVS
ncbi:MAG: AAA family ATPase [Pseudohongiellaceae bacterium]